AAAPGAATAAAPAAATAAAGRDGTDLPAALLRLAEHCAGDPGAAAAVRTAVAATRLTRTLGAPPPEAPDRCPTSATEAHAAPVAGRDGTDLPAALLRLAEHCAGDPGAAAAVRTAVAATRLTRTLGAPLAEVLDRCAASVTEAEQARDARRVALAGPRSTAR